jgi:hypothetical protein
MSLLEVYEGDYWFQDSATTRTANLTMYVLLDLFRDCITSTEVCRRRSADQTTKDLYILGGLKQSVYKIANRQRNSRKIIRCSC